MDDPADIWTIDGSLNTLSDRPGMDSQKTDTFGMKIFKDYENLISVFKLLSDAAIAAVAAVCAKPPIPSPKA